MPVQPQPAPLLGNEGSPLNRLAPKILLSLASLALALGAAEGVLRYKNPRSLRAEWVRKTIPYRQSHPVHGHGLVPGASGANEEKGEFRVSYRINSLGLRDREFRPEPPAGTVRLLVLGDSFAEGFGVELGDAFVKVLERRLNDSPPRAGARYETVNLGVAGFSPLLEYLFLKEQLPRLRGHFVLLSLDVTDFADDFHYQQGAAWGPGGEPLRVNHAHLPPNHFSHTRQFLEALPGPPLGNLYAFRYLLYHAVRFTHGRWAEARLGRIEYDHHGWTRPGNPHQGEWEEQLGRSIGHILRIRDLAREAGMGFALATHPHGHMVHPQAWCAGRRHLRYNCGMTYPSPLIAPLLRLCAEKGLACWDLAEEFRRPDAPSLFFDFDGHFTPKGNGVMAGALERRLR
ncbi:MAG: hypothetical protein AABZ64_05915, partial [Nitrospinota bacterium]